MAKRRQMAGRGQTADQGLADALDQAVEAIMAGPGEPHPQLSPDVASLLRIAADLRDLPKQGFKERLGAELKKSGLTAAKVNPVPAGYHTATPCIVIRNASAAIEFYKNAFGATELMRLADPSGHFVHGEIQIGGARIAIAGEEGDYNRSPESLGASAGKIHLYVEDVDALVTRAIAAGVKIVRPVEDHFYGDRGGQLRDPFGHTWIVATHKEDVSQSEMKRRAAALARQPASSAPQKREPLISLESIREGFHSVTPYLHVKGAGKMIDFLKRAFDAEEIMRAADPKGVIHHAELRIGDAMFEMGEAHGQFGPRPAAFHLFVDDADKTYDRAIRAGAASIHKPMDQDYGLREGSVRDPFGNDWYIATPNKERSTYVAEKPQAEEASRQEAAASSERRLDVMPFMYFEDAAGAAEFYKKVLGAKELMREVEPDGTVSHVQLAMGDSQFMLRNSTTADLAEYRAKGFARTAHGLGGTPVHLYLHVADVDAVFNRAISAGAKLADPLEDKEWGDRCGGFQDPFGHIWYVATPLKAAARREASPRAKEPLEKKP